MKTDTWPSIAEHIGAASQKESDNHPHAKQERGELFHCHDGGSTEWEFLNLIHALVLASKPMLALETGTANGFGTSAIASALQANGTGKLITVDIDDCKSAKELIGTAGLSGHVDFVKRDALEFCKKTSEKFDFVFIDSGPTRAQECEALRYNKLSERAVVVFHDASPFRTGPTPNAECVAYLKTLPKGICVWLSRGIQIVQF